MEPTKKLVCNIGKFKKGHVTGMQIHNQREKPSKTNTDINPALSHENYDLHNRQPIKYLRTINQKIKERRKSKRKVRSDATLLCEIVIGAGQLFWNGQGKDRQIQDKFFKSAYQFLASRYGKENVVYAQIHRDEGAPHMHFGFVPMTKDNRLSARDILTPTECAQIHQDFYKHMRERGFDIQQSEPTKAKHLQPLKWKTIQLKQEEKKLIRSVGKMSEIITKGNEKIKALQNNGRQLIIQNRALEQQKTQLEKALEPLLKTKAKAIDVYSMEEKAGFFDAERIKVKKEDWETLKSQVVNIPRLLSDLERAQDEQKTLMGHIHRMNAQMQEMRKELEGLRDIAQEQPELKEYVEQLELKLDLIEETLGVEFELDFDDDLELDDEEDPKRRKGRRSKRPRLKVRKRAKDRPFGRHQQQRRQQQQQKRQQARKRDHGQIIDKGRF